MGISLDAIGRPVELDYEAIINATKQYFEDYEAWYESPVIHTSKDGSTSESMERLPNPPPSILDLHRFLKAKSIKVSRSHLYEMADAKSEHCNNELSELIQRNIAMLFPEIVVENGILGSYAAAFAIFTAKNKKMNPDGSSWTDKNEWKGEQKINIAGLEEGLKKIYGSNEN